MTNSMEEAFDFILQEMLGRMTCPFCGEKLFHDNPASLSFNQCFVTTKQTEQYGESIVLEVAPVAKQNLIDRTIWTAIREHECKKDDLVENN